MLRRALLLTSLALLGFAGIASAKLVADPGGDPIATGPSATTAPLTTSDQFTLVDDTYSGTHYGANQAGTQSFAAPSGASLNIGSLVWGHNVFGYMCVVSAYAVGG